MNLTALKEISPQKTIRRLPSAELKPAINNGERILNR